MKWVRVTQADNIPVRQGRAVKLGPYNVAIFNLGGGFRTVESRCPHRNGPLADGIVAGDDIICPLHNWRLSLDSGKVRHPDSEESCIRTFETKIVEGIVMVLLPAEQQEAAA